MEIDFDIALSLCCTVYLLIMDGHTCPLCLSIPEVKVFQCACLVLVFFWGHGIWCVPWTSPCKYQQHQSDRHNMF